MGLIIVFSKFSIKLYTMRRSNFNKNVLEEVGPHGLNNYESALVLIQY